MSGVTNAGVIAAPGRPAGPVGRHAFPNPREREARTAADMKLIRRLKQDPTREADFRQLYDRYAPATFAFFLRKIGDPAEAADLNQDLYLKRSRSIGTFAGKCSWRTWVFLIARTTLAEARGRRWQKLAGRMVTLEETALRRDLSIPADADEKARQALLRVRLKACLRRLSDVARAVVIGHYFEGITLREMTARLRLRNPSGSRGVLLGAQRKLRRCLEEWGKP